MNVTSGAREERGAAAFKAEGARSRDHVREAEGGPAKPEANDYRFLNQLNWPSLRTSLKHPLWTDMTETCSLKAS